MDTKFLTVGELRKRLRGVRADTQVHLHVDIEHRSFHCVGCLPLRKVASVISADGIYVRLEAWWDLPENCDVS